MTGMRCWAYGPGNLRCEIPVGEHTQDDETGEWVHGFSVRWLDSEVVEPVQTAAPSLAAPVFEILVDTPDLDDAVPGTCFVCGCSKAQHEDGNGPCEEHDCKTYLE